MFHPRAAGATSRPRSSSTSIIPTSGSAGSEMRTRLTNASPASPVAKGRKPKLPHTHLIHIAIDMLKAGSTPSEVETKWGEMKYVASKRTRQYYISDIQQAMVATGSIRRDGFPDPLGDFPGPATASAPRRNNIVFRYVVQRLSSSSTDSTSPSAEQSLNRNTQPIQPTSLPLDIDRRITGHAFQMNPGTGYMVEPLNDFSTFHSGQNIDAALYNHDAGSLHQTNTSSFRSPPLPVLGEEDLDDASAISEFDEVFMPQFEDEVPMDPSQQGLLLQAQDNASSSYSAFSVPPQWASSQNPINTNSAFGQRQQAWSQSSYTSYDTGFGSLDSVASRDIQPWDTQIASPMTDTSIARSMGTSVSPRPFSRVASRNDSAVASHLPRTAFAMAPPRPIGQGFREPMSMRPSQVAPADDSATVNPIPIRRTSGLRGDISGPQRQAAAQHKSSSAMFFGQSSRGQPRKEHIAPPSGGSQTHLYPVGVGNFAQPMLGAPGLDHDMGAFNTTFAMDPEFTISNPALGPFDPWYVLDHAEAAEASTLPEVPADLTASFVSERNSRSVSTLQASVRSVLAEQLRESRGSLHSSIVAPKQEAPSSDGDMYMDDVYEATSHAPPAVAVRSAHDTAQVQPRGSLTAQQREYFASLSTADQYEIISMWNQQQLQGL